MFRQIRANGDVWYDKSINQLLTGAYHVLDYEKVRMMRGIFDGQQEVT